MSIIKEITLLISAFSVAYCIIMLLTPDKYRRQIKSLVALTLTVSLGSVIIGADFDINSFISADYSKMDSSYYIADDMVQKELEARLEHSIKSIFEENSIPIEKISVSTNIDKDNCIFISKISLTVSGSRKEYQLLIEQVAESRIGDVAVETVYTEE